MRIVGFILAMLIANQVNADNCIIGKYEKYAALQQQWQKNLTHLILAKAPEFSEVAKQYRDHQLLLITKRQLAVESLAEYQPEKLQTSQNINRWLPSDTSELLALFRNNPKYRAIELQLNTRKNATSGDAGNRLRHSMKTVVFPSEEYKKLSNNFKYNIQAINEIPCTSTKETHKDEP